MKKYIALFAALLIMFPASGLAFSDLFDLNIPVGTTEMVIPNRLYFVPHLVDEAGQEIAATWENPEKTVIWGNTENGYRAVQPGKETMVATAGNGDKSEIQFIVPEVYVSVDEVPSDGKITIEERKAIVVAYQTNYNGIIMVGSKGDSVSVTPLKQQDIRPIQYPLYHNMCEDISVMRLMPVKAGDYKITIKANGKTVKTITVTVKKSALTEQSQ